MTTGAPHATESSRSSINPAAGLQGAALIEELERISRVLEQDDDGRVTWLHQRPPARKAAAGHVPRPKPSAIDATMRPADFSPRPLGHEDVSPSIVPERASDAPAKQNAESAAATLNDPKVHGPKRARPALRNKRAALSALARRLAPVAKRGWALAATALAFLAGRSLDAETATDNFVIRLGLAFEKELRNGLRMLTAAALVVAIWMIAVPLAAAVIVPGNLVVQSNVKTIQHPTGGVVAEIAVHDGMRVNAGDLLLRLDATQARANLRMIDKQLNELRLRIARLVAERDGLAQVDLPRELASRSDDEEVKSLLASERSLFKARGNALQSQRELLQSRIAQLEQENAGIDAQLQSKVEQLDLVSRELTGVQDLFDKKLVPLTRLTSLQRESARIDGERGQLLSAGAETKSKISETKLQIVRVDQDFRTDVVKELGETQGKEAELVERGVAARDMLDRIEMRAPT